MAAGSDRFRLLELRISRTFLDQLRPQLFRPWIPSSARDIDGGSRRFTEVVLDGRSRPTWQHASAGLKLSKLLEDLIRRVRLHSTGLKGGKAVLGLLGPQLVDPRVGLVETCKQGFDQSRALGRR